MDDPDQDRLKAAGLRLAETYNSRQTVQAPIIGNLGFADACSVQRYAVEQWRSAGRRPVGRKIGLTAEAAQKAYGSDRPMSGILFADMEVADSSTVCISSLFNPRAEGEVAFVLSRDLTMADPGLADVIRAIEFVVPAIEIVDTRYGSWDVTVFDAIADNGASGLFALGACPRKLEGLDLALCGMTLSLNGEPASTGAGIGCLGHPLNAVRWLAQKAVEDGDPLREGEVVLSGALGPMVTLSAGAHLALSISGLGGLDLLFTGDKEVRP